MLPFTTKLKICTWLISIREVIVLLLFRIQVILRHVLRFKHVGSYLYIWGSRVLKQSRSFIFCWVLFGVCLSSDLCYPICTNLSCLQPAGFFAFFENNRSDHSLPKRTVQWNMVDFFKKKYYSYYNWILARPIPSN